MYIDEDHTIYDASLNQTNASGNNNKFYRIQLLVSNSGGNYYTWTRWGRVGAAGDSQLLGNGHLGSAMAEFGSKFKDKSGNTWANRLEPTSTDRKKPFYTFIERQYEQDSGDSGDDEDTMVAPKAKAESSRSISPVKRVQSQLPEPVQRLMQLIFNQQLFEDTMLTLEYDADKLPLGVLSKLTILRGYQALKELSTLLQTPANGDWHPRIEQQSNMFYTLIPHNFGRRRPPVIDNNEKLRREIALLESLSEMEVANKIMKDTGIKEGDAIHALDKQFAGLGLQEMTPLEETTLEYKHLADYLVKSHGSTHGFQLKIEDVFRIERDGEAQRFKQELISPDLKGTDRRLLWHGSRCTNYGGILSQGLRIAPPEAPVNGYAFGKGVYLGKSIPSP